MSREQSSQGASPQEGLKWDHNILEPMFNLRTAAEMVPFPTLKAMYMFLVQNKDKMPPARYRRAGGQNVHPAGFEERFFTLSEIKLMRELSFHDISESRFAKAGRKRASRNDPIGAIMRLARTNG